LLPFFLLSTVIFKVVIFFSSKVLKMLVKSKRGKGRRQRAKSIGQRA
jgi:hypothetical protein